MTRKAFFSLLTVFSFCTTRAQQRLELLEASIPASHNTAILDSYLWTKNWWLVSSMIPDTSRGGNAIARGSKLNKRSVDSLSKLFLQNIPADIIRFGNLRPRINYKALKGKPSITAYFYELGNGQVKLLACFRIEFDSRKHNEMADVSSLQVLDPSLIPALPIPKVIETYQRKATVQENNITPPAVQRNER